MRRTAARALILPWPPFGKCMLPKIVRVHTFGRVVFLRWSNEISTFFIFRWIRAPILSGCMLWVPFSESRVFSIGLTKYKEFWCFDGFVCCIGRPFDHHFWAFWNHRKLKNVKIAQGFSYFLDTRANHIEQCLLTIHNSWALWSHRQIAKCWNYTRFFILFGPVDLRWLPTWPHPQTFPDKASGLINGGRG